MLHSDWARKPWFVIHTVYVGRNPYPIRYPLCYLIGHSPTTAYSPSTVSLFGQTDHNGPELSLITESPRQQTKWTGRGGILHKIRGNRNTVPCFLLLFTLMLRFHQPKAHLHRPVMKILSAKHTCDKIGLFYLLQLIKPLRCYMIIMKGNLMGRWFIAQLHVYASDLVINNVYVFWNQFKCPG